MAGAKRSGQDVGLLILRLTLGGIMMAHGITKLVGSAAPGLKGFQSYVASLGIPYAEYLAPAALIAEIGGGLLVITGVLARFGALAIAIDMIVAIAYVHAKNGFFLKLKADQAGPIPHGFEYNLALIAMALAILLAGPGSLRLFPRSSGGG